MLLSLFTSRFLPTLYFVALDALNFSFLPLKFCSSQLSNLKFQLCFLVSEHNIMHEVDRVIQWTLQQQIPSLADPVSCSCKTSSSLPQGIVYF